MKFYLSFFMVILLFVSIVNAQIVNDQVEIRYAPKMYTPFMSSTVGIGVIPEYAEKTASTRFYWHAEYGHFLSWAEPDFKVKHLGTDVINTGDKIFWSFDPKDSDQEKKPVKILLFVIDIETKKIVAHNELKLVWKDNMTVEVDETKTK